MTEFHHLISISQLNFIYNNFTIVIMLWNFVAFELEFLLLGLSSYAKSTRSDEYQLEIFMNDWIE